ncbi:MAG: hypothetical protein MUC83_03895 [Pirellula sp.]|nr:hypothetical protein [Pirellula sp.]
MNLNSAFEDRCDREPGSLAHGQRIHRRAVLRGIAGAALALPALEAMGEIVTAQPPRRFCALYTANGMSLPKKVN